ncbi:MAG: hypothetical protein D6803_01780 [Anaerolineae bacterium]|nr:MAG: hypothetical protein D6803_01780 [Anaerolineae bacterium]
MKNEAMKQARELTVEDLLYLLAFLIALGVRLLHLGSAPLSDAEADLALRALDGSLQVGTQPLYVVLTSWLFFLIAGSSNFLARFWPAVAGAALALAPRLFHRALGRRAALILAFFLALDPGLVAVSRQADGRMLALLLVVLTVGGLWNRRPVAAGVAAGLALLAGPAIWQGLLAWGAGWLAERAMQPSADDERVIADTARSRSFLLALGATLLLVGTGLLHRPAALGALGSSLVAYLRGWATPTGVPWLRPLAALVFYQPLAWVFFGFAALRSRRGFIWLLVALLMVLIYPARAVADAVWVSVPLLTLAALGLAALARGDFRDAVVLAQGAAWPVILAIGWMALAAFDLSPQTLPLARLAILPGVILLGALATLFVGLGWSWQQAQRGSVLGLTLSLGLYALAMLSAVAYLRPASPLELWAPPAAPAEADLLDATLQEMALRLHGERHTLQLVSLVDAPSLRWVLRQYSDVRFQPALEESGLPPLVIASPQSATQAWTATYRGQDFYWRQTAAWETALPSDLLGWWTHRRGLVERETLVLWARADVLPAAVVSEPAAETQSEEDVVK